MKKMQANMVIWKQKRNQISIFLQVENELLKGINYCESKPDSQQDFEMEKRARWKRFLTKERGFQISLPTTSQNNNAIVNVEPDSIIVYVIHEINRMNYSKV